MPPHSVVNDVMIHGRLTRVKEVSAEARREKKREIVHSRASVANLFDLDSLSSFFSVYISARLTVFSREQE